MFFLWKKKRVDNRCSEMYVWSMFFSLPLLLTSESWHLWCGDAQGERCSENYSYSVSYFTISPIFSSCVCSYLNTLYQLFFLNYIQLRTRWFYGCNVIYFVFRSVRFGSVFILFSLGSENSGLRYKNMCSRWESAGFSAVCELCKSSEVRRATPLLLRKRSPNHRPRNSNSCVRVRLCMRAYVYVFMNMCMLLSVCMWLCVCVCV